MTEPCIAIAVLIGLFALPVGIVIRDHMREFNRRAESNAYLVKENARLRQELGLPG